MCYICGRGNCCPSFHQIEEQEAFAPAEEAFENFLRVKEQCFENYNNRYEEEEE